MASIAEMQAIASVKISSVKMDIVKQDASRRCERWPDEPDSDAFFCPSPDANGQEQTVCVDQMCQPAAR
jgi:hypothetical protein